MEHAPAWTRPTAKIEVLSLAKLRVNSLDPSESRHRRIRCVLEVSMDLEALYLAQVEASLIIACYPSTDMLSVLRSS